MHIAVGADHRGFAAKRRVVEYLRRAGHQVIDVGCDSPAVCDYIDYALAVGRLIGDGEAHLGILLDASGVGMAMVANKVAGVRAAVAHDEWTARTARETTHCNILCLPCDLLGSHSISKLVGTFLHTAPGEGRHARRVRRMAQVELQAQRPAETASPRPKPPLIDVPGVAALGWGTA